MNDEGIPAVYLPDAASLSRWPVVNIYSATATLCSIWGAGISVASGGNTKRLITVVVQAEENHNKPNKGPDGRQYIPPINIMLKTIRPKYVSSPYM